MTYLEKILATTDVENTTWYHGRTVASTQFDQERTGQGKDQEGPGFYFTTHFKDASGYAAPSGVILEVKLTPRKLASNSAAPKRAVVEALMKASPDFDDVLTNWDENPQKAFQEALKIILKQGSEKEVFEQVWFDFYRNKPAEYLRQLVKMGFDGHFAAKTSSHIIIYNPEVIEIVKVTPYSQS